MFLLIVLISNLLIRIYLFAWQPSHWISVEMLFPFVTLDYQRPFPSTFVPFRHQGNKSMGRKWRDNEEIMWKKQHLILISYWGGGVEGWREKLKELLVKRWSDRVSEKLTVTEEKNAVAEGNKEVYERAGWAAEGDGFVLHETRHVHPELNAAAHACAHASCEQHWLLSSSSFISEHITVRKRLLKLLIKTKNFISAPSICLHVADKAWTSTHG